MLVIGDVHGCYYTLKKLLTKIPKDKQICFVGDLIDRGNYSHKVYYLVKELVKNNKAVCVRGNHEQMFIDYFTNKWDDPEDLYVLNGGLQTIKKWKEEAGYNLTEAIEFFQSLPVTYKYKNYTMSHALSAGLTNEDDIMWNRYMSVYDNKDKGHYAFGHTPQKDVYICDNVINVDTDAYKGNKLSAIDLDTFKIYSVNTDKKDIEVQ